MKNHLIDTFLFNDGANVQMLDKIALLKDKTEAIRMFSHLINCQYKWMARILQYPRAAGMSWWEPVYPLEELDSEWTKSLEPWLSYIAKHTDEELKTEVTYTGYDGEKWAASPMDVALQLNYHSIHHRAQIQLMIRSQGLVPDFIDYIGTRSHRVDES